MFRIRNIESSSACMLQMLCIKRSGGPRSVALPVLRGRCDGLPPELDNLVITGDLQGLAPIPSNGSGPELAGSWVARELANYSSPDWTLDPTRTGTLLTGGFFADPELKRRRCEGDVDSVWRSFADNYRWTVGVPGCRDLFAGKDAAPEPAVLGGGNLLTGGTIEVDGLRIAGLGGVMDEDEGAWHHPMADYLARLDSLIDEDPDIILLHDAPAGPGNCCKGKGQISDLLFDRNVLVPVIFGHTFWLQPLLNSGSMQFVNVDARVIVLTR